MNRDQIIADEILNLRRFIDREYAEWKQLGDTLDDLKIAEHIELRIEYAIFRLFHKLGFTFPGYDLKDIHRLAENGDSERPSYEVYHEIRQKVEDDKLDCDPRVKELLLYFSRKFWPEFHS